MSLKEKYYIEQIECRKGMPLIIKNHYLHRKAPCSFSFALKKKEDETIVGIVMYGSPASPSLCKGLCGTEEKDNVLELTRLWVSDEVERNGESFLIGNTIKLLNKEIIVSFADTTQNHIGYVYQATNWLYTGLSAKHIQWSFLGSDDKHCRHIFDSYGGVENAKKILGDKMVATERPRKHRYVFFNASKKRKKELLAKLKYPILPYPKLSRESQNV